MWNPQFWLHRELGTSPLLLATSQPAPVARSMCLYCDERKGDTTLPALKSPANAASGSGTTAPPGDAPNPGGTQGSPRPRPAPPRSAPPPASTPPPRSLQPRVQSAAPGARRVFAGAGPAPAVAMTAAVFFGCAFVAFGPALALYIFTIAAEPLRIIFLIVG